MDKILDILIDAITMDNMCHKTLNADLERDAEREMEALNDWVQEHFPELHENDLAYGKILAAMCAREKWMLKNGIQIGIRLMTEGMCK
ncbi:MAG: hypothetical protein E7337_09435 [Clostridiales bacterium]|nr:hypothetical protein [Clostridiales bacterium]